MKLLTDSDPRDLTELDTDTTGPSDFGQAARAFLLQQAGSPDDEGERRIVELPLGEPLILGRSQQCGLTLPDGRASRSHARLYWEAGELYVQDLSSRNGTLVNGVKLEKEASRLNAGDRIRIGSHEFLVALVSQEEARSRVTSRVPVEESSEVGRELVVAAPQMTRTYGFARRIAATNTTALVLGETGTGKDVLVRQMHAWSPRAGGPLIRVNCAALPEALAESELFGHEKGAFTGAVQRKIGLAEAAHGGTLFLDEIGELSPQVQAKLLTMLENRSVTRVGSTKEIPVDLRVVAATHRDLTAEVEAGRFREDLYYRIGVVILRVPPLRERVPEIMLLAELFAKKFGKGAGFSKDRVEFSVEAQDAICQHRWPGNIRELRNAIEHAMLVSNGETIRAEHLPEPVTRKKGQGPSASLQGAGMKNQVADLERQTIEQALFKTGGNRTHAALELGVSLRSLLYKIKKYGIS